MKKIFATLFILLFSNLSASANYQVFFGNTGHPVSYSRGGSRAVSMNNFGSNAAFAPKNTRGRSFARDSFARPVCDWCFARPRSANIYRHNHDYIMARTRNRQARMRQYISTSASKINHPVSRFDKNYQLSSNSSNKSVTCGGITYYGATNACR